MAQHLSRVYLELSTRDFSLVRRPTTAQAGNIFRFGSSVTAQVFHRYELSPPNRFSAAPEELSMPPKSSIDTP